MQETPQEYTQRILSYTDSKDPLRVQRETPKKLATLIRRLDKKRLTRRPAPDKWSIAEIITHLADTEIVAGWRLRQILSTNGAPIQSFDQNSWASTFKYGRQDTKQSLETFRALREYNLAMLKSVPKPLWENYGMHQERGKESVGHIVRMFAGHDVNHVQQVEKIVKEGRKK
jgi:DinB superfamily